MPRNPCLRVWPETIPLQLRDEKEFFGKLAPSSVTWWAPQKRRIGKARAKSEEKNGFWFPTFCCVSGQTLKQGSHRFTIGQTRVSGFGLKCTGIQILRGNVPFFTSVSVRDTGKKRAEGVFWISTSRKLQAKPLNTGRGNSHATKPVFKGLA